MSLYLRNLLAHRQAEREAVTAASMQAAFQQKPPSQARIEALRRWNQKRQAEAKKATQAAEKKCRDAYWPWFCSLPEADRHRAWTLAELVPNFRCKPSDARPAPPTNGLAMRPLPCRQCMEST